MESEDVAQDEHRELAGRQDLKGGHEGQGDGFGLLVAGLRAERRGDGTLEQGVGKWLKPDDFAVYASYQPGHTLIEHDLVDELRLFVFPVVIGAGERLFGGTSDKKPIRLLDSRTVGHGLAFLTYEIVRDA